MSVGRKGGHCFEVRFDEAHCMGAAPAGWGAGNAAALLQHHHHCVRTALANRSRAWQRPQDPEL